jgi:transcription antitermination factor NusG
MYQATKYGTGNGGSPPFLEELTSSFVERAASSWYALMVRPRAEAAAARCLEYKGYEVLLPLYRSRRAWSDRVVEVELPLFAGYVFCRFDPTIRQVPILTTPNVLSIVSFGKKPTPLDNSEINSVRLIAETQMLVEPWSEVEVGAQVRIVSGALQGAQGSLVRFKNQDRLIVSISLLQRSISVQIDKSSAIPADPYHGGVVHVSKLCTPVERSGS